MVELRRFTCRNKDNSAAQLLLPPVSFLEVERCLSFLSSGQPRRFPSNHVCLDVMQVAASEAERWVAAEGDHLNVASETLICADRSEISRAIETKESICE